MPVLLTNDLNESGNTRSEVSLFHENGELNIAGNVVAHFLETADFSDVFDHPAVRPYIIRMVDEADASIFEEIVPGTVALQVIDEDDLAGMFLHYLDLLGENATGENGSLEDKTTLIFFESALLKPLEERYKKGAFRKMRSAKGGKELVNRMLGAIMSKGQIKRAKKAGGGYRGGDYERTGRYKSGERKAHKQKRGRIRKVTAGKIRASQSRTRGARKRAKSLSASVGMEEGFLFGFGEPYSGAIFQVGVNPNASVGFTEAELDELKKSFAPCYDLEEKCKDKGGKFNFDKKSDDDGEDDGDDGDDDEDDESVKGNALRNLREHAQPAPVGIGNLTEGAALASKVVGVLNGPKKAPTLNETKH